MNPNLQALPVSSLANLLKLEQAGEPLWSKAELAQILHHLLASPAERATRASAVADLAAMAALQHETTPPITTLQSLLDHPAAPLPLLRMVKDFAKVCRDQPDHGIPAEVAIALYFACTAQALSCHGALLTSLKSGELLRGLRWLEAQEWVDQSVRRHAHEAIIRLQLPAKES